MTSATDNRTTELLKDYAFALRRLEYAVDKPGSNMTLGEYEAEEKRVTDDYAQAIAATLGRGECEFEWSLADNGWVDHTCTNCGYTENADVHVGLDWNFCPNCGCWVVDE